MAASAVVLADDRAHGACQREDDAIGNGNEPSDDGEACNRFIAEGGNLMRHVGIGEGCGDLREDGGVGDCPESGKIAPQAVEPQRVQKTVHPGHAMQANREGYEIAQHRGDRRTLDAQSQAEDEDRGGAGRDDGGGERDVHGPARIAEAAQDEGAAQRATHQYVAGGHGPDEDLGKAPRFALRSEQAEQPA